MPLSYVRWYVRREMAHGRVLIVVRPPDYARSADAAFMVGKGRPAEDVPIRTAKAMIRQGEVEVVGLPDFGLNPLYYAGYKASRKGWKTATKTVFGTHEFWSWFGGSYGYSKRKMMVSIGGVPTPPSYSPPTLKEWGVVL